MAPSNKPAFLDLKLQKISGGDLLCEKPVFCDKGKTLAINNKETCHLYSTSTGEHIKQLFSCKSDIICIQADWKDSNKLYAVTKTGELVSYRFDTENESKTITLNLKAKLLNKEKVRIFDVSTDTCSSDYYCSEHVWDDSIRNLVHFTYAIVESDVIYASWYIEGEFFAHVAAFNLSNGNLSKCDLIPAHIGLEKAPHNFDVEKNVLLCMCANFVFVASLSSKDLYRKHKISRGHQITCIALAREELCFATGDTKGQISIWRNIFGENPLKEIFHWHTLPVRAFAFTDYGANMFSGGEENVLVKWSMSSRQKTFLPRLTSAITHLTFAEGGDLLAVSTADSRILIVNMNLTCLTTIQHFSRWVAIGRCYQGTILAHDPRADALVLNARTGHLQFLSTVDGRFLYTFDVTNRNYITRQRHCNIENVEVHFAKFSRCGKWLITVEYGGGDSKLKFWHYKEANQEFSLNTEVDSPHGCGEISYLEISSDEQAVTTGPDGKFRLWNLVESTHLQQTRLYWTQVYSAGYKELQVAVADFARDGSIVGVSFGPALTIWDTDSFCLKCSLTPPLRRNIIKEVRFGNHEVAHLVVVGSDSEITCWNLVTLCMQWMVPLQLVTLVSDPNSIYMCAFSRKGGLFIFSPASSFPDLKIDNVSKSEVTTGLFLTKAQVPYVYFLNANQELYCLGEGKEGTSKQREAFTSTPFATQLAEISHKDVVSAEGLNHLVKPSTSFPTTIMDGPAHALPPVSFLLHDVLRSLLQTVSVPEKPKALPEEDITSIEASDMATATPTLQEPQLRKVVSHLFSSSYLRKQK